MRTVVNMTFTMDEDISIDTVSYLLDNAGVSDVSIKSQPHFEDWCENLPREPVAGLSDACTKWIHSWGSGGGNLSDETMVKAQIAATNSDAAAELAYAILCSVSDSGYSEFDAEAFTMDIINGSMSDLCIENANDRHERETAGACGKQPLARCEGQFSVSTGKKLRLILLEECCRDCPDCCNKDFNLSLLPICRSFQGYDCIMLTGGEPMLYPSVVLDVIRKIRLETTAPIILYTALTADKEALSQIMQKINGLTVTLHNNTDVEAFLEFDSYYCSLWKFAKSLRLNVFKGVDINLEALKGRWIVKFGIEWIKNCPLPEGEVLMRLGDNHP